MAKQKFSINIFDIIVIILIVIVAAIAVIAYNNKPFLGSKTLSVEVKVSSSDMVEAILPILKTESDVFYSGTKYPVEQISYRVTSDASGKIENLFITLNGLGNISDGGSIFNGQRIYVNQKVEIHSDYQVQGYVTDFHYAD